MRLLLSNFSNVWKVLVYYIICIALTIGVCYTVATPILSKLSEAGVFESLGNLINSFLNATPTANVCSLNQIIDTSWQVIATNIQFRFNYVFLIVWLVFIFPFTLDLAQLALGEVFYGFMTSQVKYGFTGRYIKNISKSLLYTLVRYFVQLVFNVSIVLLCVGIIKLVALRTIGNIFLSLFVFAFTLCFIALKHTLFSCWMPAIAVLDCGVIKGLKQNFKCVFNKFPSIFSNYLTLVLSAFVVNAIFALVTFSVSIVVTMPLTAVVFVICQMVSYFSSQGMRFYVYQDVFISPKRVEEQDKITKLKHLI